MPNFLDLAREIRDMIYTHALGTEHILIARNEIYPNPNWDLIDSSIPVALLQVNKQVNAEAMEIFLAQNTFKASLCPALGRPSVFTTHARLFRNIDLKLSYPAYLLDGEYHYITIGEASTYEGKYEGLISMWKQQMRMLGSMTNLSLVQLEVTNLVIIIHNPGDVRKDIPTWALLRELLTSLPQDVRKKEGCEDRGIWITGFFYNSGRNEMHEMGEVCRDFGLNFMTKHSRRCAIPLLTREGKFHGARLVSSFIEVEQHYYG
jgi:hypothetical protein